MNTVAMAETSLAVAETFDITEETGFLPSEDPLVRFELDTHPPELRSYLAAFDELGKKLPDLLEGCEARLQIEALPAPPDGLFDELNDREVLRLCLLSGFFASGYVNQFDSEPVDRLPEGVAIPLYRTSKRLGRKPMLSYDLLCLHNFQRRDPESGLTLDNLDTLQQFTTYPDERWFVVVHVAIEAAAGPGLLAMAHAQQAARRDDPDSVRAHLDTVAESLDAQTTYMSRMTEGNDPAVFATEFRPYYGGFEDVVYEGVDELGGEPQTLRGGSGAQSCVLPSLDSALGIEHASTALLEKLLDMRTYMPERHRRVIDAFADDVDLREYVLETENQTLEASFNRCLDELRRFRNVHFGQVMQYIASQTGDTTGTGGTDYSEFLGRLEEETVEHKIS